MRWRSSAISLLQLTLARVTQLASLQILSLGATQASPSGVLTGHTFAYDHRSFGALINVSDLLQLHVVS